MIPKREPGFHLIFNGPKFGQHCGYSQPSSEDGARVI